MVQNKAYSSRRGVANTIGVIIILATLSAATTILVFNSGILNTINTEIEKNDTNIISAKIVTNINNNTITETNTTTTNPQNNKPDHNETKQVNYYQLIINELEGSGASSPVPGVHEYQEGDRVSISTTPSKGWRLDHLIIDGHEYQNTTTEIIMNQTHTVNISFSKITYNLTISTEGSGNTNPPTGTQSHYDGTLVQVHADASSGWIFDHWNLNEETNYDNPIQVLIDKNHILKAVFSEIPNPIPPTPVPTRYTLNIQTEGSGATNPGSGTLSYNEMETIQVSAIPSNDWEFDHWIMDGANAGNSNPIAIKMETVHTLKAVFTLIPQYSYTLTVKTVGQGSILKNPTQTQYSNGKIVQLTATPSTGYVFTGWSGGITSTTNPISITITGNMTITATFVKQSYNLIVNKVGTGGGSVSKNPNLQSYKYGSSVTLTATPEIGSTFAGWSDGLSGTTNPATITITSSKTVTARFTRITPKLTILTPEGSGTTSLPIGVHTYNYGNSVQITATPDNGEVFDHWELDGLTQVTDNPITLTMSSDHTLKAIFTQTEILGIFSDSSCNIPLTNLSWGTLSPDTIIYQFIYIKNLSNQPITLQCIFTCTPEDATNHITITWDRENVVLAPNASIQATFTLEVKEDIHDVTDFNIDIEFIVTLP